MDELSEDQLRELEEQLYSQVHHQTTAQEPIISEENPNVAVSKKGNENRYWVKKDNRTVQNQKTVDIANQNVKTNKKANKANPKDNKVRNPFSTPPKVENYPFRRQGQKLQRAIQYENKKRKSKHSRASLLKRPKIVETILLESSEDDIENDEVVVVPLPPLPIYAIDDTDDDEKNKKSEEEKEANMQEEVTRAAFATPQSKKSQPTVTANEQSSDVPSRCNSPNSVMSQDDFIGQNDRQRLLKTNSITEDSDLLILTNNADSLLEPPTPPVRKPEQETSNEIKCIGTFIKPTGTTPRSSNKQCYRVDESGVRAMDVYESESDIVSDGVYSKGTEKLHPPNTTIRNIDRSSSSDLDDVTTVQTKTKRLRKRRASSSHGGLSAGMNSSESDDDGVESTGVPFIARGPAVESCKSKKFRKSSLSQNHMSDSVFISTLNSLAQGVDNEVMTQQNEDDDSDNDRFPTARDIAETVLNQQEQATSTNIEPIVEQSAKGCGKSTAESEDVSEMAVPTEIADGIEKLFDKMNELAAKKAAEDGDGSDCEISCVSQTNVSVNISTSMTEQSVEQSLKQLSPGEPESQTDCDIKYFMGYTPANRLCMSDGFGWNEEMRRFYNFSWGGENFREQDVWRLMNRDKRLWIISEPDRNLIKTRRDAREKCINCFSFGHTRAKCPKPRKPVVCYMCGENGHQEPRCPNTRCLRCGGKTSMYSQNCRKCIYWNNRMCPICKLRGHSLNDCPDKWRRYHSTTRPSALLESRVIYNKRRYCCYCGRRGHLFDECRIALYRTEYPPTTSEIKSHEKSYHDVITSPFSQPEIPCRLLYDPKAKVNSELAAKTTRKHAYGRFLCAVGLEHLIGVKSSINQTNPPSEAAVSTTTRTETEANLSTITSPDQVQEVSESTNLPPSNTLESLKMPPPHTHDLQTTQTVIEPIIHDSDSNYSFSDHFELPTSSQQTVQITEPLPDFIPLNNSNGTQEDQIKEPCKLDKSNANKFGISARYVEFSSDTEDNEFSHATGTNSLQPAETNNISADVPCEAKIYISAEHSSYLQSEKGQQYLNKIMLDNHLIGQLNKTIVGYALFINGLPADQEKLQKELETKFKMLDDDKYDRSVKVPRNVDTLISYLRSNIKQLYTNLGNAVELCRNLNRLHKQREKSSIKAKERIRRKLNMIFLGQAGLSDGYNHIQTLLGCLHTLLNNYKGNEKAPDDLRNKIDSSYRMIFTSLPQKDYPQLLLEYNKKPPTLRNQMLNLKVDPSLLGNPQFNICPNDDQRTTFCGNYKQKVCLSTNSDVVEEGTLLLNVVSNQKSQQTDDKPTNSKGNVTSTVKPNTSEKSQKSSVIERFLDKDCQELLSEIKPSSNLFKKTVDHANSRLPSAFWSRESLRILLQLIHSESNNPATIKRLTNISKKAASGELSYNDYRIVAELYNITMQMSKK